MYIAFKWLVGLTLSMWVAMCCVDLYLANNGLQKKGPYFRKNYRNWFNNVTEHKNIVVKPTEKGYYKNVHNFMLASAMLHYVMFFAGATAVILFDRKKDIFLYTKTLLIKVNIYTTGMSLWQSLNFKISGNRAWDTTQKFCTIFWNLIKCLCIRLHLWNNVKFQKHLNDNNLQSFLFKRLKEISEEKKKLEQLLVTAVNENKIIKMQYHLEVMAKNRFERYIVNTQKIFKENRSRCVSFQHLYLVTHHENVFLKSRIKKLSEEKDETQTNLFNLVHQIFRSSNTELKTYCSQLIVQTKGHLLKSDVNAEIQKLLKNTFPSSPTGNSVLAKQSHINVKSAINRPKCSKADINEILPDDTSLVPVVSDAPRLRGLPGEYVLTIKDKDGLIEKLYEYDYKSDLDRGETVKRIRQYSVFHDKDCFLDCANSKMSFPEDNPNLQDNKVHYQYPIGKFVTSSEAFQKFLENNKNVISLPKSPLPSLDIFL